MDIYDLLLTIWCRIPQRTFRGLVVSIPWQNRDAVVVQMWSKFSIINSGKTYWWRVDYFVCANHNFVIELCLYDWAVAYPGSQKWSCSLLSLICVGICFGNILLEILPTFLRILFSSALLFFLLSLLSVTLWPACRHRSGRTRGGAHRGGGS